MIDRHLVAFPAFPVSVAFMLQIRVAFDFCLLMHIGGHVSTQKVHTLLESVDTYLRLLIHAPCDNSRNAEENGGDGQKRRHERVVEGVVSQQLPVLEKVDIIGLGNDRTRVVQHLHVRHLGRGCRRG